VGVDEASYDILRSIKDGILEWIVEGEHVFFSWLLICVPHNRVGELLWQLFDAMPFHQAAYLQGDSFLGPSPPCTTQQGRQSPGRG
jgi:hypothetical protein